MTKKTKGELELRRISLMVFCHLETLSHSRKKALLLHLDKLTQTNCWWFDLDMKNAIEPYLKSYFYDYEKKKKLAGEQLPIYKASFDKIGPTSFEVSAKGKKEAIEKAIHSWLESVRSKVPFISIDLICRKEHGNHKSCDYWINGSCFFGIADGTYTTPDRKQNVPEPCKLDQEPETVCGIWLKQNKG